MITKTASNPPPNITFLASKYLKGERYFNISKFSFKSMTMDKIKVKRSTLVAKDAETLGFL